MNIEYWGDIENLGGLPFGSEEGSTPGVVELLVRDAISNLSSLEREVIVKSFFLDHKISEIAEELNRDPQSIRNIQIRAAGKIKIAVGDFRHLIGLTDEFNRCAICNHGDLERINEYTHVWLDDNNWNFRGLLKELTKKYKLSISTLGEVIAHVKLHMGIEGEELDDRTRDYLNLDKSAVKKSSGVHKVNLSIPIEIKREISKLAFEYNRPDTDIYRWAIKVGVIQLQSMLETNEKMFAVQLELNRFMRKISKYD